MTPGPLWHILLIGTLLLLSLLLEGCKEYSDTQAAKDEVCFNVTCPSYCLTCIDQKWDFYTKMNREKSFETMKMCGYDQRDCDEA